VWSGVARHSRRDRVPSWGCHTHRSMPQFLVWWKWHYRGSSGRSWCARIVRGFAQGHKFAGHCTSGLSANSRRDSLTAQGVISLTLPRDSSYRAVAIEVWPLCCGPSVVVWWCCGGVRKLTEAHHLCGGPSDSWALPSRNARTTPGLRKGAAAMIASASKFWLHRD
jgi:hypothetical protein